MTVRAPHDLLLMGGTSRFPNDIAIDSPGKKCLFLAINNLHVYTKFAICIHFKFPFLIVFEYTIRIDTPSDSLSLATSYRVTVNSLFARESAHSEIVMFCADAGRPVNVRAPAVIKIQT